MVMLRQCRKGFAKNKQFSRGLASRIYAANFFSPSIYMEILRCFEKGTRFERNKLRKINSDQEFRKISQKYEASAARLKNLVTRFDDTTNISDNFRGNAHNVRYIKKIKFKY